MVVSASLYPLEFIEEHIHLDVACSTQKENNPDLLRNINDDEKKSQDERFWIRKALLHSTKRDSGCARRASPGRDAF